MATFIPNITDVFPKPVLAETDFNFVDKVLQRKQGLYQQGLEKVKNSYDSILYAPLTDKENFPIRDKYITQAKEDLKNLSSSDFSGMAYNGIDPPKPLNVILVDSIPLCSKNCLIALARLVDKPG